MHSNKAQKKQLYELYMYRILFYKCEFLVDFKYATNIYISLDFIFSTYFSSSSLCMRCFEFVRVFDGGDGQSQNY